MATLWFTKHLNEKGSNLLDTVCIDFFDVEKHEYASNTTSSRSFLKHLLKVLIDIKIKPLNLFSVRLKCLLWGDY